MRNKKEVNENTTVKITVDKAVELISKAVDDNIPSNEAIQALQVRYNLSSDAIELITEKYEELG